MAKIARCDNCSKETTLPVFDWYEVERWVYPDHRDKRAPTGPWHFCSMTCIGKFFSERVERLNVGTMTEPDKYIETLVSPRYKTEYGRWLEPWLCNHANENPNICTCPSNCSCRKDMCAGKPLFERSR